MYEVEASELQEVEVSFGGRDAALEYPGSQLRGHLILGSQGLEGSCRPEGSYPPIQPGSRPSAAGPFWRRKYPQLLDILPEPPVTFRCVVGTLRFFHRRAVGERPVVKRCKGLA